MTQEALLPDLALYMLFNLSPNDLWFGMSEDQVFNLLSVQAEYGLVAIEISWVNFILVCGLFFTIPIFISFVLFFFRFLPKYCGWQALFPSAFLLINTFLSNGIWSKTLILSTSVMLMIAILGQRSFWSGNYRRA